MSYHASSSTSYFSVHDKTAFLAFISSFDGWVEVHEHAGAFSLVAADGHWPETVERDADGTFPSWIEASSIAQNKVDTEFFDLVRTYLSPQEHVLVHFCGSDCGREIWMFIRAVHQDGREIEVDPYVVIKDRMKLAGW